MESWDLETDAARDYLTDLAGRLEAVGITAQTEVSEDDAASAIVSYAEQHPEIPLLRKVVHFQDSTGIEEFSGVYCIGGRLTPALCYPATQAAW